MKGLIILCLIFAFTIAANSQSKDKSVLTGTVYDAYGAVVVNAKVTATNIEGQKFETTTDDDGGYNLDLAFNKYEPKASNSKLAKYDIVVHAHGFKKAEIKGYVFIPSSLRKMFLDIALEVAIISDFVEISGTERQKTNIDYRGIIFNEQFNFWNHQA